MKKIVFWKTILWLTSKFSRFEIFKWELIRDKRLTASWSIFELKQLIIPSPKGPKPHWNIRTNKSWLKYSWILLAVGIIEIICLCSFLLWWIMKNAMFAFCTPIGCTPSISHDLSEMLRLWGPQYWLPGNHISPLPMTTTSHPPMVLQPRPSQPATNSDCICSS